MNEDRGQVTPFQGWSVTPPPPCAARLKSLNPATALREHEKATPHRARITTLPGQDHGADRRLLTPGFGTGSARRQRPRHSPARPETAAKEKILRDSPENHDPHPLPDRSPSTPWKRTAGTLVSGQDRGYCFGLLATMGMVRCKFPVFGSTVSVEVVAPG